MKISTRATSRVLKPILKRSNTVEVLESRIAPAVTIVNVDSLAIDADGDGLADPGDLIHYTVTVQNTGPGSISGMSFQDIVNDPNLTLVPGSINVSPLAIDDTFNVVGNTLLRVGGSAGAGPELFVASGSVTANDFEFLGDTFTLTTLTNFNTAHGVVNLAADGSFTYLPTVGYTGADSFTYTIKDKGIDGIAGTPDDLSSTGTVAFNVTGKVWYVDNSFSGTSTGSSVAPFKTLADVSGAAGPDGMGDTIYIRAGSGNYDGGLTLLNDQVLLGENEPLTFTLPAGTPSGLVTLKTAGSDPTLVNTTVGGHGVTLASGNTLKGFVIGNTGGFDIANTASASVGTLTISNLVLNGTGGLFRADSGGTLNVVFDSASTTSATGHGIHLAGTTSGSFTVNNPGGISTISGVAGTDVFINGGTASVSIAASITSNAGGSIEIANHSTGAISFSNNLSVTAGTGISVHDNPSGTITFSGTSKSISTGSNAAVSFTNNGANLEFTGGSLVINATSGAGINASGNTGTLSVTGAGNTITTTTGTALSLVNSPIAATGLTFQSISSNGAASGIILNNTGTAAGLTVTGDATTVANGSGGTIQNSIGAGISLTNTSSVSLDQMNIQNGGNDGISGTTVTGFTLSRSNLTSNGNADEEHGIEFTNLLGTVAISSTVVRGSYEHNLKITNTSGTLDTLNITGSTFDHTSIPVSPAGGNGILITLQGSAVLTNASISGSTFRNNFSNGILVNTENNSRIGLNDATSSASVGFVVANNTFDDNNIAVQFGVFHASDLTVDIQGNTIVNDGRRATSGPGSTSHAIVVGSSATAQAGSTLNARIDGNTIGSNSFAGSGSSIGSGIRVIVQGLTDATVVVNNNTIRQAPSGFGMELTFLGPQDDAGTVPTSDITVTNNNVDHRNLGFAPGTSDFPLPAIYIAGDNQAGPAGAPTVRADVRGNTVPSSGTSFNFTGSWIEVYEYDGSSPGNLQLVDNGPASANATAELQSQNTGTATANAAVSLITGSLTLPPDLTPLPLMLAPEITWLPTSELPDNETGSTQPEILPPGTAPLNAGDNVLSQAELDSIVSAAIARWEAAGLTAEQSALLHNAVFTLGDLPGWYLGKAEGGRIVLDQDAAGNGWFVDETPLDDSEYANTGGRLSAGTGAAAGRLDVLTTVMHEMGHILGLEDSYVGGDSNALMYGYLHLGERRVAAAHDADGAVPHADSGADFLFTSMSLGAAVLPAGKSITIVYDQAVKSTINASQATSQISFTSSDGTVLSDDPSITGTANPTVTPLDKPDVTVAVSAGSLPEDGGGSFTYTFTRQGPTTDAWTANFSVTGTANTSDYTFAAQPGVTYNSGTGVGTVTFAAGQSTATVLFGLAADATVEPNETLAINVQTGTNYDVGTPSTATATIVNDDTDISVSVAPASVTEDGAGNLVYTFTRTGVTTGAHTVNFSVTGSPTFTSADYAVLAAAGITFTPGTGVGTVAFAAGETTKTVTLDPTADSTVEADETATVNVLAGTGYNIGTQGSASGTITNDDTDVTLAVSPGSVSEDGTPNLVYTFTRAGVLTSALTVNFTVGGTATFGTDYGQSGAATFTATTGTITFAAGSNTATLILDPTAETLVESDETTALTLAAGTGYNVVTAAAVTGTISNDDTDVTLAVSPASANEDGAGTLLYTFTRTGVTTGALTVNFSVAGSASFGTDYTQSGAASFAATTGTVTFAAGSNTATVTLNPTDDTTVEANETALLTVTSGTGYNVATPSAATGTILNDDTDISVSVAPASVTEDGAGNLVYTFTRTGVTTGAHTVNFSVTGSPTLTSADYSVLAAAGITFTAGTGLGTVAFAAGETTKTVTLDPTADSTVEADETATVNVLAGTGYNIGAQGSASGAITNDDSDLTLSVSPASVTEDGTPNLVYTFTRTGFITNALTVNFTVGGSAAFGTDYGQTGAASFTSTSGTITFAAGSSTATLTLDPTADTLVESDETTSLTLASGTGYNVATAGAVTGTISNDDTDVTLAVSPASTNEDGSGTLLYTFTRTGVTTGALTVNFTVGGTAAFGADYTQSSAATFTATNGTVTFAAGSNTATITLNPTDDTTVESDETAILTLASGTGYNVASPGAATGTILNDDTDITVAVAPATVTEDGASNLVYTFTRTGVTTGALTVNFNVGGTAAFGTDYSQSGAATFLAASGTVTFAAGSSTATVTLDPTADSLVESNETASLTITSGAGYNIGAASAATGTITNDDASVTLAVSPASVAEDGAANLIYTFTRTGFIDAALTVNFTVGGSATLTSDYAALGAASFGATTGTVTFLAGSSTASVTIDPVSDTNGETDETVALSIANGSGYSIGAPSSATGTILNDDTAVSVAVTPNVLESGSAGLVYTFNRTGDTSTALTVNFAYDGTATIVSDYTQAGAATFASGLGTIVIPIGQSSAAVTLTPQNDTLVEGAETVAFTVQAGAGYGVGAGNLATGTIDDNDFAVIRFTNELENVTEGTPTKLITVELLVTADGNPGSGTLARGVSYNLATLATGTASASDFTFSSPQTITYNPGQGSTTTNIAIGITDDRSVEGNETVDFRLNTLVDGTGGNVTFNGPVDDTLTIRDNDSATIGFVSATSATAENGTPQLQVGLVINATGTGPEVLERPVSLTVSAAGGTASGSGTDYTFADPQTITFAAGAVAGTQTLALTFNNDTIVEGNETILFTANALADGTNGQITQSGSAQHALTITDNDTATLQFVAATGSANENGGNYAFDVSLVITANGVANSGTLGRALNFAFTELTGDTATLGSDYTVASYAGSFGAGATSGSVTRTVTIDDDTRVEGSETARFGLQVTSDGTGGQVSIGAQATHTLTIADNDTATISLVNNGTTVNESAGSLSVGFALTITANGTPNSGTLERDITINLKDAGIGSATPGGSDYTFSSPQTVTFASGEGSSVKNVSVGLIDDTRLEGTETIVFLADNFVDGTGGSASFAGQPNYAVTVQDNETAVIQLAADSALVDEAAGGLPVGVTLTITANGTPNSGTLERPLSVNLTDVLPRTATPAGVDYSFTSPQTITFGAGDASSTKIATVSVVNDSLSEGSETLTLQLGALNDPTGQASLGARQSTGITIVDDDVDLALQTTESANVIVAGGGVNLTYTIIVSNVGLTTATGIVIAEDLALPQGVRIVSITPKLGSFETTVQPDGNWTIASMAPGTSATLTIVLAVDASAPEGTGIIETHASITSTNENAINPANDASAEATSIDRQVDLQIAKTDSVSTVIPGGVLSYAVNYANNGPSNATGVVITETLPAGTVFNAAASTGTWVEGPAGTFKLLVGGLATGSSGSATFAVTASNPAPAGLDNVTNTAVISDDGTAGGDVNPGNNSATDVNALDAAPDLQVSVIDDPIVTKRGDTVRYIVSFINVGNQDATNVFLTMTLPANTTFDLGQSSGSWISMGGDVYRIDLGNLGVGATPEPVAFAVRVNSFLPAGHSMLSTVATIDDDHANGTDPVLANNTETENTPIYQGVYAVAPGVALPRKAGPPVVQVYDIASGLQTLTINAYEGTYRDSVRVALGDINGDGYDDIITSTRAGNGRVRVFDGVTGERFEGTFAELAAFPEAGARGAFVASGDVTGDGHDDIIVGSGQGARGGGKVKVFDGVTGALVSTSEPFGARFHGGVRVAVGDVNGDSIADVIASQGYGGNDVLVTRGATADQLLKLEIGGARYHGGVFVAAADLNNDGVADLIAGRDRGATVVETFNGANGMLMNSITPFAAKYKFGARVAAADINLDGIVDIIVGAGGRGNSEVKVFSGLDNQLLHSFQAFPTSPTGSLFVAGTSPVPGTPIVRPA